MAGLGQPIIPDSKDNRSMSIDVDPQHLDTVVINTSMMCKLINNVTLTFFDCDAG
jgi:hypothetical protein